MHVQFIRNYHTTARSIPLYLYHLIEANTLLFSCSKLFCFRETDIKFENESFFRW